MRIQAIATDKAHNENKDSLAKVRIGRCADMKGTLAKTANKFINGVAWDPLEF
nr:9472_t:CDS:2 [Entrophospora candida]